MRRSLPLVVLAVAMLAVVAALWGRPDRPTTPGGLGSGSPHLDANPDPLSEATDLPTGSDVPIAPRNENRLAPDPRFGVPRLHALWESQTLQSVFVPADPVETGPAALELGVVDEATGAPVSGTAVLWRLDAPANAAWQAGDQQQARIDVEEGVGRVRGLPEGLYRVLFEEQRGSTEDPAPFEVRAPRTEVTLRVPMPRRSPRFLRIVDERGQPLEEAWISYMTLRTGTIGGDPPPPEWARRRVLREPHPTPDAISYVVPRGGSTPQKAFASAGTFSLGEPEERIRSPKSTSRVRVQIEGRNDVWINSDAGPSGPEDYLAVALPLGTLLRRWTLPDGSPIVGSTAKVDAACSAERVTAQTRPDRWFALTVHVRVGLEGYEPLEAFADADVPEPPFRGWVRVGGRFEVR